MLKEYIILLPFLALFVIVNSSPSNDYGSFSLFVRQFAVCQGPKRRDCCAASAQVINGSTIIYDAIVNENISPNKGKIVAMSQGKEFVRLQMKKPCDHLFMRPLFQTLMNVTKNCVILKGHYNFKVDLQDIAQKYYAGSFLFGNWTFKSIFYSDDCNFSCSLVDVELSPKNKTKDHKL